ncbi:UNVERIFIED_ORG: Flp pilus assembly protein TadG [Shinella zoogloeoides]|nr:Flp pilus assembly protein TadG [Shinella zoogloeoides]
MSLDQDVSSRRQPMKGLLKRFYRRRDGATAIEFAILAIPFFVMIFASLETFVAFTGEQLLANATENMARKIRTGQIKSDYSVSDFRKEFCEEISILMPCSAKEIDTPDKLLIDVRSFDKFTDIPQAVPLVDSDLDTKSFKFAPGGKKSINIVRAYYRWDVITDLVRPLLSNVKSANGSQNYLMIATAVVQNEDYP